MHKFKKRCLSTTLGLLVTAANTLGCFSANSFGNVSTLTAKAASTSNAQANSLSAIGIDTTKAPEGYDEYDDSNPYGMNVVTPKPVSELLIADDETGTSSKLYGHDKSFNAGNLQNTFLENPIENGSNIFNKPLTDDVYLPSDAKEAYAENMQIGNVNYCAVVYRKTNGKLYLGIRNNTVVNTDNDICINENETTFKLGNNFEVGNGGCLVYSKYFSYGIKAYRDTITVYNGDKLLNYHCSDNSNILKFNTGWKLNASIDVNNEVDCVLSYVSGNSYADNIIPLCFSTNADLGYRTIYAISDSTFKKLNNSATELSNSPHSIYKESEQTQYAARTHLGYIAVYKNFYDNRIYYRLCASGYDTVDECLGDEPENFDITKCFYTRKSTSGDYFVDIQFNEKKDFIGLNDTNKNYEQKKNTITEYKDFYQVYNNAFVTAAGNFDGNEEGKKSQYAIMYYSPSDFSYYLGIREGFNDTLQHNDMKIGTIADFGGGADSAEDMMSKMKLTVGDFDGNGTDDIAFYDMKNSNSKINVYKYSVGSDVQKNSYLDMRSSSGYWVKMKEFDVGNCTTTVALASGDLDNDGICDLAYAVGSKSSDNCTVAFGSSNSGKALNDSLCSTIETNNSNVGLCITDIFSKNRNQLFSVPALDGSSLKMNKISVTTEKKNDNTIKRELTNNDKSIRFSYYSREFEEYFNKCINLLPYSNDGNKYLYYNGFFIDYTKEEIIIDSLKDYKKYLGYRSDGSISFSEFNTQVANFDGYGNDKIVSIRHYPEHEVRKSSSLLKELIPEHFETYCDEEDPKHPTYSYDIYKNNTIITGPENTKYNTYPNTSYSVKPYVVLNTDNDTAYMKYSGKHYYSYSDPCVLAVLASPPYFKDLLNKEGLSGGYAQSSTTYGASKGTETGTGSSKSIMAGGYVSFEQDFSFMGMVDIASVEAEAEFTGGFTDEYMDTSGLTFSADYSTSSGSDAVVLYSIPSIKYEYEYYIPNHENNSYVVNKEIVTIPRTPAVITMELDEYDTIAAEYPELPKIKDNILTHTVGEPATYPKSINSFKKATVYDGEFFGVGFTSAENGMTQSQSIEITEQSEYKYDTTFATSESVGAGAGGITVGAKFDYESSDSEVNVSAVGCTFSAEMQNMPIEAKDYGYGMNWKLFSYEGSYKNANGESVAFPVLSYIVSDVSQPFDIPSDFEQDYENSSSNEIALSWTYPKNTAVEGFDIYRYYEKSGISGSYYVGSVDVSDGISTSDGMSYSFKDTNLPPYTEFEYQIKAVSSSAPFESMFSNTIKASTFSDEGLPEIELRGLNNDGNIYVYPDSSDKIVADVTNIDMYNSGIIYQWQKKDGDIWYDIAGKTSDSYSFVSSGYSTAGEYRCRVSGIYYDKTAAQAFYVTTYSDSFNAIFDMRKAVAENEVKVTYENNIPEAEVTLVSSDSTHHNVPTGNVIFKIEGGGYSKSYTVALRSDGRKSYAKLSDFNSYSNDKVTELPDGYYTLSVYYCGNKMFSSSEIGEDKFVIGAEGYYVRVSDGDNETTEIPYGSNVIVRLYKITDADSAPEFVKESNVGITYELGPHTASISNNGINYKTQYRTVKREIHVKAIGATHFIVGNVTAEQLPKLTLSNGSLAPKHQNDKNDPREVVELQYLNSNKEAVSNGTLSNGLYTPNLVIKDNNYNIEYDELPDVMVTSEMVTVTVTPVKYAGIKVGTVSMTSPDVFTSEQLEKGIEYSPDSSITLKAETFEGYEIDCWKIKPVNGTNVTTMYGEKITYRMLNEKVEIKVYFKPVTNTLGYEEKPEGGKVIAPTGFTNNSVVRPGNEFTFKAVPDTGYHFVRWEKITSSLTEKIFDAEYRLVMPDEDVYLYPVFEKSSFSINFNGSKLEAVCNGKVLKGSSVNALYGDTVTIRPANGSRIADGAKWIINGTETNNSDASFVIQKLNSDMTVSIDTELMSYNASVKAEKGSVTVKYGNNTETGITDREYTDIDGDTELVLTANADYGFVFDHWDVNGSNAGSENSYTVSFSENKVNVKAVFRQNENKYTMSLDAGKHGKIVYSVKSADGNMIAENAEAEISDITVYKNDTVSLKFVPDKFRSLVYWDVNGNVNMSKELKLENIDKNYAIKAENAATAYTNVYYSVDIPDAAILSARTYENDYISGDYIGYGDELTISADKITNGYSIAYWTINGAVITDDENNVCTDSTVSINADGVTDVILHVEKTDVIPASRFAAPNVTVNNEEGYAGWNAVEDAECYNVKLIANNYTFFEKYITATDITFETIPQNCIVSVVAGYISNGRFIENSDAGIAEISAKSIREKPVVSAEGSVISWNKINGIANYVVTVNGTSYFAENQNSMTIVTEPHTEYNITVAGVIGNTADSYAAITENGEYTYTTGHIDADSDNVCDDCGKVIASKIRNMSVSIGSDFSMRFAVQLTDEQLDAKMIFTREGTDISEPVSGVYDEEMNCYIYTYNGIKTQWLADSVKAELVLNDEVLDTMSDRSVLNYCDKIYNASKTIPEYEKYVVLMADMLEYGAEAQKYIGYKTDRLANSPEWVAQNKTSEFKVPDSINSQTVSAESDTSFCGKSITLNNAIDIRFKIQTNNIEGLSIVIKKGQKEISRNNISDLKEDNGYYIAVSDPVKATQYNDAYTAVLMRNGVEIQSATYSVNSCIAENYKNSALGNLFVALVNFGASAYNFEK